ncbi:hypothetical protein HELRODRAFT_166426 [Helobdella robusta]|uniref:Uncharacterized protein n=1 Tax=Helobdella robusta TaxID=6412 RepID=T1EY45_HELRO|nr:hypothetical protein HELRODRAFT_166426 [Helobdella robusta]ESN90723.1 hypothetical protein HELRODRAFT_166426 [Helobdella robusta]
MSAVVCFATLKLNIFIILINIFLINPFETTSHFPETSIIQQMSNESNSSSSAISDQDSAEDSFAVTWTNRIRQKEIQRHQINQNIMRHLKLSAKPNITAPIKLSDADMVALNKKPVHCPRKQKQMKSADVFCYILLSACHLGNTNNNNNNHKNDLNFEFILPQFLNEDKDYLTNIQHAKLFLKKYLVEIENKLKRGFSNQWHMMNIKKLMQSWKRDKVHILKIGNGQKGSFPETSQAAAAAAAESRKCNHTYF